MRWNVASSISSDSILLLDKRSPASHTTIVGGVNECSQSLKVSSGPAVLPVRDWAFIFSSDISMGVSVSWLATFHHLDDLIDLVVGLITTSTPDLLLGAAGDPECLNFASNALRGLDINCDIRNARLNGLSKLPCVASVSSGSTVFNEHA